MNKRIIAILLALAMVFCFAGCKKNVPIQPTPQPSQQEEVKQPEVKPDPAPTPAPQPEKEPEKPAIDEKGSYDSKDDVALYIHTYGHLPSNYITKKEAQALGWEGGSLEKYAKGKCIGGDRFGNYEGLLPKDKKYTECDIDTLGQKSRGAKRIIFSNDGYIYYTEDHYSNFELLYEGGK